MRLLTILTSVLCLAALPALAGLVQTTQRYRQTTAAIDTLRFEIVTIAPVARPDGPVPAVTLRASGLDRLTLTLAEVSFDLETQGRRLATARIYPGLPLIPGAENTVTVTAALNPDYADETRALLRNGGAAFDLRGRVRVTLPDSNVPVWVTLQESYRDR